MNINWTIPTDEFPILLGFLLSRYAEFQFSVYQSPQPATEAEFNGALRLLEDEIQENLKKYQSPAKEFIEQILKHPYFKNSSKKDVLQYCQDIIKQELDFLAEARESYAVISKFPEVNINPEAVRFLSRGERAVSFHNEVTTSSVPFYNYRFPMNAENKEYLRKHLYPDGALRWEGYSVEDFAVFDRNGICKIAFCTHENFINSNFSDSEIEELKKAGFKTFINTKS
jgi:hypothetical protein